MRFLIALAIFITACFCLWETGVQAQAEIWDHATFELVLALTLFRIAGNILVIGKASPCEPSSES